MRIFISYSHNDEATKDRLVKHLRVLQLENIVQDVWDDSRIAAGADWRTDITAAMTTADLGVLLISVDFLTSQFIREQEVPDLLKRRVFPIIVRACPWQEVQWLRQLQVRPKNGKPLPGGKKMDEALTIIAREIAGFATASSAKAPSSVSDRGVTSQPPITDHDEVGQKTDYAPVRWHLVLDARIDEVDRSRAEAILSHMRPFVGDPHLTIVRIKEGSVIIVFEGSTQGFRHLHEAFRAGEVEDILGLPILAVQLASDAGRPFAWRDCASTIRPEPARTMAGGGIREFKSFIADFRNVPSLALKAAVAAPWVGVWTKLAPPPTIWSSFLSSLAECLTLVWAFKFWSDATDAEHGRRMKRSLILLCITAVLSISAIQLFSVSPGSGRERVVVGFALQPPVQRVLSSTYTTADALRDSGFDPTAVWTNGSVTLMEVGLNILWVIMFASLSVYLVSFVISLRRVFQSVRKKTPPAARS